MLRDGPSDDFSKDDWNSVADQPTNRSDADRLLRMPKSIVLWEGLQQRDFPQREGPILGRVAETPAPKIVCQCRHRRGDIIPDKAAIDAGISSTSRTLMTIGP